MHHVRDTIFLTDTLLELLRLRGPKADGLQSVTFAGRRIHLGGGDVVCSRLDVVADEIDGVNRSEPAQSLTARAPNRGAEDFGIVGLPGPVVDVAAKARHAGAGLTTSGGKGATVGISGRLTVELVDDVPFVDHWIAAGADDGSDGTAIEPVRRVISARDFVDRQIAAMVTASINGETPLFTEHLERCALHQFRLGDLHAFARDLERVDAVFQRTDGGASPVSPLEAKIETARRRRAEHRDHVGLARDLDVEPVLTRYRSDRSELATGIFSTLFPRPFDVDVFRGLPAARIRDRARAVATMLESYRRALPAGGIGAAGVLEWQVDEMTELKDKRLAGLHQQATDHLDRVLLPWLAVAAKASGTILVPGGPNGTTAVDADAVVTAIAALPDRGVALPVVPELLVTPDRAPLGPFSPDDPAVGVLRAGALDLHRLDDWGDPTAPAPLEGIDVGRIVDQLADATLSDLTVLDGLRELADLVRQQLRTALRSSQAAAAIAERHELAAEADAVATLLRQAADDPNTATTEVARHLVDGVRIMSDALAWDARFDDRALALRSGDLRHDQSIWDAWADALAIDHVLNWYEAPWHDAGPEGTAPDSADPAIVVAQQHTAETDAAMRSFLSADNGAARQAHAQRGLLLSPANSRLTITRVFNGSVGAEVLARFKETGSCWFEIPLDSLPKAADGARRYHEVVAAGVSVRLVGAKGLGHADLVVRHSGRGQLALVGDGRVVDQPLSPGTTSLEMRSEPGGMFGVAPAPGTEAFTLAGRAIAAQWSLQLSRGAADLDALTAIEVQVDLEAFVPVDAVTVRRFSHPVETMVPGSTARATVELTGPAPGGGVPVIITTSHPEIAEPHSVTVPAGAASAQFDIDVKAPTGVNHVVLTARMLDGASARVVLEIPPPAFEPVHRISVPDGSPVRTIATVRDRTFAVIDPPAAATTAVAPRSIVAFDTAMQPRGQAIAGVGCRHVVADEAHNRLYVVNGGDGESGAGVRMLDATTLQPLAEWPTDAGVAFAAIDHRAGLVYVSHWIGRKVFVLDADDLTQLDAIGDATFTGLLGIAVDPALRRIYVARTDRAGPPGTEIGALSVIERRPDGSHGIGPTIPLGVAVQPHQVAVDPTLGLIYVLGLGDGPEHPQLIVLDRGTLADRARIPMFGGLTPDRTLATREGTGIVHATGNGGIQVIDVKSGTAVGMIAAEGAGSVVARGADQVVGATTLGELVRVAAPQQITTKEWR